MELSEHSFLEELLALRRDSTWETIPTEMNEFLSSSGSWGNFDYLDQNPPTFFPNSSCTQEFSPPFEPNLSNCYNNNNSTFSEAYYPLGFGAGEDGLSAQQQLTDSSYNTLDTPPFPVQEDNPWSMLEEEELGLLGDEIHNLETQAEAACKMEPIQSPDQVPVFNMGMCEERNNRGNSKKLQGQPSKNLMAERRRRKRLNDRLSMLRSIVPKISKMDRTSILGDTIDYMKELLERINNLQQEIETDADQLNVMSLFKDVKPNEMLVRNSPKFDVQRRNVDTRIDICCAGKPGLLLSTVSTLEALGLEIQQCVISCFNDFAMQASCSEDFDQRTTVTSEDIKQALFRNAGYGGRCL
ncbi:bHLH transcription factor [Prunus yedoensis var. nudiflora]|uniref:BHLH transcription factor n=1 Tax=Prunus yedoensis var. nudiflora TaxID=2094558 RepID=A0A314YIP4_PRUYE|nr:bHLH transcription factor [Prunus yedoensis var. nudiflora]